MTDTTDTPPRKLSVNPKSPLYDEAALARGVGVKFKGVEKFNVEEYDLDAGYIRVAAGAAKDRFGNPMTMKLTGPIEVWFKDDQQG